MLQVTQFPHPFLGNTYLVFSENEAFCIDMGMDYASVLRHCESRGLTLKGIFLTHGHYDHIQGLRSYSGNVPIYIGAGDLDFLTDGHLNQSLSMFRDSLNLDFIEAIPISEMDEFTLGGEKMKVLETPFHTRGSLCFYFPESGLLFSGDTLFRLSIGRDDLPGAMPRCKQSSLQKLITLPPDTKVHPGHMGKTTIGFEVANNPLL